MNDTHRDRPLAAQTGIIPSPSPNGQTMTTPMKDVSDFVAALQFCAKSLQFYNAEHPRTVEALATLETLSTAMLRHRTRVSLTASQGALVVDGEPLVPVLPQNRALAAELEKRQIGGIVIAAGVTQRELLSVTRLLVLKVEQIKAAGGADEILRRDECVHVRISKVRYEAVTEGEEVVWSKSVQRGAGTGELDADPEKALPVLLQRFLLSRMKPGGGDGEGGTGEESSGDGAAAGAPVEEALAAALRGDGGEPTLGRAKEVLRAAITGLDPAAQVALLVSIDRLPASVERKVLKDAASELMGAATGSGTGTVSEADAVSALVHALAQTDDQLELLRGRLAEMGVSREQLDEVLEVVTWDKLPWNEKLRKLLTADRVFEIAPDKLLRFVREMLELGHHADLLPLMERYSHGLEHQAFYVRQTTCDVLGQVVALRDPGISREVEQVIGRAMLNHLVREQDLRMKSVVADATANFLVSLIETDRCEAATRVLERLDAAVSVAPWDAAVRVTADALRQNFGDARRAASVITQIGSADPDSLTRSVLPFVALLGEELSPRLVEALGEEEDRNRRGRLVRALKTIGPPAFPFILEALHAHVWYVARNALNVLADIGTTEHVDAIGAMLQHSDARVKRAAVRALGRIGGIEAEIFLVQALSDRNAETQSEALVALGALKSEGALPSLIEMAKTKKLVGDEKVRETAIVTIGQIGAEKAVPALLEILKPKGLFARESADIRIAAAKALAAIGTKSAKDALQSVAAAESDRTVKDAIARL